MTSLEFVGGKEACQILGVHQRTLYQWDAKKLIDTIMEIKDYIMLINIY
jgi:predicted site-specific integrase-resolvase